MGTEPSPDRPLDDPDAFLAVSAIRDAIPTRVHADMLFDLVTDLFGDAAWVDSYNDGTHRVLHRRAPDEDGSLLPWPILTLGTRGRIGTVVMVAAPEGAPLEPPPRPGRAPRLRNLGPGQVLIHDGPQSATITYGDDGRWMEVTRGGPKESLWGVIDALAQRTANPVELLAAYVAALDAARHGPGRVMIPERLPTGVQGVWICGLRALRDALFDERIPMGARWVVADGFSGDAIGFGDTREAALAAWRREVDRIRPRPPEPPPPPESMPEESVKTESDPAKGRFGMSVTMRGPKSDVSMPEPTPANTPAVVIEIGAPPAYDPPIGVWKRLLGGRGATVHAAFRREHEGFTMLGERLAAVVDGEDLQEIERAVAVAEIDHEASFSWVPKYVPPPGFPEPPKPTSKLRAYSVVDEDTGAPTSAKFASGSTGVGFHPRDLDGDALRWKFVRQRWLPS